MINAIHHIHIKSTDPKATADWYVEAFGFKIVIDLERPTGDRLVRCALNENRPPFLIISGLATGQTLPAAKCDQTLGLEHFALTTEHFDADLQRLTTMGALLAEGPLTLADGTLAAFIKAPGDVRIELVQFAPGSN